MARKEPPPSEHGQDVALHNVHLLLLLHLVLLGICSVVASEISEIHEKGPNRGNLRD